MTDTLFERLGGEAGIRSIASDMVDNHLSNPLVAPRFMSADIPAVKKSAANFFIGGTGGPDLYEGQDLVAAHKGMNISDNEFMAAVDDVVASLTKNKIGDTEKAEVLFILYSLRPEVVRI